MIENRLQNIEKIIQLIQKQETKEAAYILQKELDEKYEALGPDLKHLKPSCNLEAITCNLAIAEEIRPVNFLALGIQHPAELLSIARILPHIQIYVITDWPSKGVEAGLFNSFLASDLNINNYAGYIRQFSGKAAFSNFLCDKYKPRHLI